MKPEVPSIPQSQERAPIEPSFNVEAVPETGRIDSGLEKGAERKEQTSDLAAAAADAGLFTSLPTPVVDDNTTTDDSSVAAAITTAPLQAADNDLIEREWVDKAKKIVSETKSDPYQQEKRVSQLQADYIKKRYGRKLGEAA
jgi:hypothetical protein